MSEIQDQIVRAGGQVYAEALQEIERLKRLNTEERSELYGSHSTSQPRSFGQSEGKRGMLEF